MCLVIKKGTRRRKAKKDIIVYKLLSKKNDSVVYEFRYRRNTLYFGALISRHDRVEQGFHAYLSLAVAQRSIFTFDKIVKMTIPKGSFYYISALGAIASNQIKTSSMKAL